MANEKETVTTTGIGGISSFDKSIERPLYDERQQIFEDTINFKKAKRIPTMSNFLTWKVFDAGYTLGEACYNWDIMEKVMRHHIEKYAFDVNIDNGWRNPNGMMRAFGWERHVIDDEKGSVEVIDSALMDSVEEFKEYMADPQAFLWTKMLPRRRKSCGAEGPMTKEQLYNGALEFVKYQQYLTKMNDATLNEYQIPLLCGPVLGAPYESIYGSWRGLRLTGGDLRRHPNECMEICDWIWENQTQKTLNNAINGDTSMFIFDSKLPMLSHSILNTKQFKKFYWPALDKIFTAHAEAGKTTFVNCEADMIRFADFFNEVPRGVAMVILEMDDIFEFRKVMPNLAVAGGMTNYMLQNGTKQECIDFTKKLVDELGEGYAMSQNKLGAYRNDGKSENVLAVNEFLKDYKA